MTCRVLVGRWRTVQQQTYLVWPMLETFRRYIPHQLHCGTDFLFLTNNSLSFKKIWTLSHSIHFDHSIL